MEEWKDIPGFDGIYEASNKGRIRSKDGKQTVSSLHGACHWKQRVLKQSFVKRKTGNHVDAKVTLWKDKRPFYFLVSRLVALAWCPGFCDGYTVNHIDGNPENNAAENLEWVDIKANIQHGFVNGLYKTQKRCTLISKDGIMYDFRSQAEASRYLNRNAGYINNCIKKKRHAYSTIGESYKIAS